MSEKYKAAEKREIQQKIGKQIKWWRQEMGITQESLGELVNLSTTTVSRLETGSQCVAVTKLVEIANALKIDAGLLFCDFIQNENHQKKEIDDEILYLLERFSQKEKQFLLGYMKNFMEFNKSFRE